MDNFIDKHICEPNFQTIFFCAKVFDCKKIDKI